MSIIRYTLQVQDDKFSEQDIFKPVFMENDAYCMIWEEVVKPLHEHRMTLGEPDISLVKVEIVNPHKHKHDWKKTYEDKYAGKVHYVCQRCKITGWRRLTLFNGESCAEITRHENYSAKKFEFCQDQLAKLPKTIKIQ